MLISSLTTGLGTSHITAYNHILIAVSGGSDSIGLLYAVHDYCKSLPTAPRISVITIDHGLRVDSAREAYFVKEICAQLNVPHTIKEWSGQKPKSAIQKAARHARRDLIARHAGEIGADVILLGHTQDDQVETIIMRERRGSNLGLSGIAPATLIFDDPPIWMLRPFLNISRNEIRDWLKSENRGWMEDPSNSNPLFERSEIRASIAHISDQQKAEILNKGQEKSQQRHILAHHAADMINTYVEQIMTGLIKIHHAPLQENSKTARYMLRILTAHAGKASQWGSEAIAQQIIEKSCVMRNASHTKPWRTTTQGALIDVRKAGVFLLKEARNIKQTSAKTTNPPSVGDLSIPQSLIHHAANICHERDDNERIRLYPWPNSVPLFDFECAQQVGKMLSLPLLPLLKGKT